MALPRELVAVAVGATEGGEGFEDFGDVVRFGAGEVFGEGFGGQGGDGLAEGFVHEADALGEAFGPGGFGFGCFGLRFGVFGEGEGGLGARGVRG